MKIPVLKKNSLLKRVLGIALSVSLELATLFGAFSLFTATAQADDVEHYELWIGNDEFTSENLTIDSNDMFENVGGSTFIYNGSAVFNPETNTLTLCYFACVAAKQWSILMDSATQRSIHYSAVITYKGNRELNIVLEGRNKIVNSSSINIVYPDTEIRYGLYSTAPVHITANGEGENVGKMTVNAGSRENGTAKGIRVDTNPGSLGSLSIDKGEVNAIAGTAGNTYGIDVYRLTISGGVLNAEAGASNAGGSYGISATYLTMNGGSVIAAAESSASHLGVGMMIPEDLVIGNATLIAEGEGQAIAVDASQFTNSYPGTGWTNRAGTEGETVIPVEEGYSFPAATFRRVEFTRRPVLTVVSGDGDCVYEGNATVTITADQPTAGKRFAGWTTDDDALIQDPSSPQTTIVLGGGDVTVTANYEDMERVANVTFSPAGGTYSSAQNVTLSCATSGANIYYTTDGSTPTSSSTLYTGAINVSETKTIKAIAIKAGMLDSEVASATYTISIIDNNEENGNDDEANETDDDEEKDAWELKFGDNEYWQALDDLRKRLVPLDYEDKSGSPMYMEGMDLAWNSVGGKFYWYEDCIKQGTYFDTRSAIGYGSIRGREIYDPATDSWFWLDSIYYGARAADKEVWIPYIYQEEIDWYDDDEKLREIAALSDKGMEDCVYDAMKNKKGKWTRYGVDGKMLKGWVTIEGELADIYPDQAGNTYYYDTVTGLMAKGVVTLNGVKYSFNEITGALEK